MKEVLAIALFGAAGAVTRYGVNAVAARLCGGTFPYATLAVNVAGCFLIGVVMAAGQEKRLSPELVAALTVGFLGALTTFSAFSYQTWQLWESFNHFGALLNIAANIVLCLLATWAGLAVTRLALRTAGAI